MTLPEAILLVAVVLGIMVACPKLGKKGPAKRKPLPRRGPFRAKENPLKQYREPRGDIRAIAEARRCERLIHATPSEERFQEILRDMGFVEWTDYEREHIHFYPGSFCLFDYYFLHQKIAVELDGSAHDDAGQHNHDIGRDEYFARNGIRTVRIRNRIVLGNPNLCRSIIMAELGMVT